MFHKIDWEAYRKALSRKSRNHRISWIKLSHRLVNTNVQNKKYYNKSDTCPCCDLYSETFNHLLSCLSEDTTAYRETQKQLLSMKLKAIPTPLPIVEAILEGIAQWEQQQFCPEIQLRAPTYGS